MRSLILLILALSALYSLLIAPELVAITAILVICTVWLLRAMNPFRGRRGVRR